jgi:hypothetical protein
MSALRSLALALFLVSMSGCYAARVETGLNPSPTVIKKSFAASWIYGLVPPATINTATSCPNGVAIVQTRLSFVNQLVGALTLGIYTPMEITVTCAQGPATGMRDGDDDILLSDNATTEEAQLAFTQAAVRAVETGRAVIVRRMPAASFGG